MFKHYSWNIFFFLSRVNGINGSNNDTYFRRRMCCAIKHQCAYVRINVFIVLAITATLIAEF